MQSTTVFTRNPYLVSLRVQTTFPAFHEHCTDGEEALYDALKKANDNKDIAFVKAGNKKEMEKAVQDEGRWVLTPHSRPSGYLIKE